MLTAPLMGPTAHTLEALQVATLEEGRIHANVFRFGQPPEYSFRLWRWTKFRDGWKRAQLFQAADIGQISLLLEKLEDLAHVPDSPDPKSISLEYREYAPNNLVRTFEHGNVQAFICDPQKPKPVEPFFTLRQRSPNSSETASWFYTSELTDFQRTLAAVRDWYQQLRRE